MSTTTLERIIGLAGGVGPLARSISEETGEEIDYDRVYQWRRSGRVPGWAIVPLQALAEKLGHALSSEDIAELAGPVLRKRRVA